jgi:metallo-beta-lactamase class B
LLSLGCATFARPPQHEADQEEIGQEIGQELKEVALGSQVLLMQHDPGFAPANVLAVRMPDGTLVLCSSPYDTGATRTMVRRLRRRWRPPRIVAINVHFHPDGSAGNAGYALEGVETYGSDLTAQALARRGPEVWALTARSASAEARRRIEATPIVAAARTFRATDGLRLTFGGEAIQIFHPGPGHSPDNLVVYFPSRRLLFGGDLVRAADAGVGYRGDADLARWPAAVDAVAAFPADVVVPGHGAAGGPELLRHTRQVVLEANVAAAR